MTCDTRGGTGVGPAVMRYCLMYGFGVTVRCPRERGRQGYRAPSRPPASGDVLARVARREVVVAREADAKGEQRDPRDRGDDPEDHAADPERQPEPRPA